MLQSFQPLQTNPRRTALAPFPRWTYPARGLWLVIQSTLWRLAWKKIWFLRPAILKCFGATVPLRLLVSEGIRIHLPWDVSIGQDVAIGPRTDIYNLGGVTIGDRVVISQDVCLCGGTHDYSRPDYPLQRMRIVIEDDVWIAAGAFIGPGVRIGRGAVVGARAVVMGDVPAWKVVAGSPARVIKDRVLRQA